LILHLEFKVIELLGNYYAFLGDFTVDIDGGRLIEFDHSNTLFWVIFLSFLPLYFSKIKIRVLLRYFPTLEVVV